MYTEAPPDALTMARRFLGWKIPKDFCPDSGISFAPYPDPLLWPIGTNLFNENQAKAMFEHCLYPATQAERGEPAPKVEISEDVEYLAEKLCGVLIAECGSWTAEDWDRCVALAAAKVPA
jgi:hypothetical protein